MQRLSTWINKFAHYDVANNLCDRIRTAITEGTYADSRLSRRLERIVRKTESWQNYAGKWENRILKLFGMGDEIVQTKELLQRLRIMESSYGEIHLLADVEPALLLAMYTKKQLSYQSVL